MVAGPGTGVPVAEDFSLYPPEVFLALSDYLDKLFRRADEAYALGYRVGRRQGWDEGRIYATDWFCRVHEDEQAELHYREVCERHRMLSRDIQYCTKAANTDPWRRSYDQHMALAWRNGFRMREVQEPYDEDFHPYGDRHSRQREREEAWESWQEWMAERKAGREGPG